MFGKERFGSSPKSTLCAVRWGKLRGQEDRGICLEEYQGPRQWWEVGGDGMNKTHVDDDDWC